MEKTRFRWREAWRIGIDQVDAEHQEFFSHAARIDSLVAEGAEPDIILEALEGILAGVRGHFAREEVIFYRIRFPDAARHRFEHVGLLAHIEQIVQAIDRSVPESIANAVSRILAVLLEHILVEDMRVKPFLDGGPKLAAAC